MDDAKKIFFYYMNKQFKIELYLIHKIMNGIFDNIYLR